MNLKSFHENEARILALELYNLNLRREEIEKRLRDISVIMKTIERIEQDAEKVKENEDDPK